MHWVAPVLDTSIVESEVEALALPPSPPTLFGSLGGEEARTREGAASAATGETRAMVHVGALCEHFRAASRSQVITII